jgi:hypothetical protein
MGIFDFLGDLSSKRSRELGLGGLQSLLGTRGAAQAGAIGDEMIGITNQDSLPGYFNEQTREYVPWYVDLFDGGGLNAAGGQAEQKAAQSGAMGVTPGGAPVQSPGLLANNQLSDMERKQRSNPLSPFGGAGPAIQDTPDTSYYTPPSSMQMPNQAAPGAPSYTQPSSMQVPSQAQTGQSIPASGGNMAINTPAAQSRDQMIADQQMLVADQAMKNHPNYPEYVDFLNRYNLKNVPGFFERYLKAAAAARASGAS